MSIYDFTVKNMKGEDVSLKDYESKPLLIVNTASKCGFTPQYEGLQALYDQYKEKGLEILAFPCNQFAGQEPGDAEEIKSFCSLNYGVSFPVFAKIDVRGAEAHPLFDYLSEAQPFEGFDENHPIGTRLKEALENNFPDFLEGKSVKWNFTKFLVNKEGEVVSRYEPTVEPKDMTQAIEALL
ncbi:glutathione peroxidase [Spirochaeta cellobiosiphila]|uniref:glutathione peroxidase n=1 Tax=Spirochaeta cellobiosiphila TaxID=504483 RepID=UPI00042687F5|nr:glutathione peroxidase [Spirochaeta cellobiosiphila]